MFLSTLLGFILLIPFSGHTQEHEVPYPDGYRQWVHVKSMLIQPGHPLENPFQGIHHIYANQTALKGLKKGVFPNGSILVFDLLQYSEKNNAIQESARKLVGVMHKNARRYSKTGGWGFEGFADDSNIKRLVTDGGQSCFSCHKAQAGNGYVFSHWRK
ncbi:MAG: cytochrome P460 family protein [Gammaproteobacteria bacterium]|nr:cytochrome P460 family protein [Gammaproteobacteria bacterium]